MTRLPRPLRPLYPIVKPSFLAAAELIGPVVRRLPRARPEARPPRHTAISTERFAASNPAAGVEYIPILPRFDISRELPRGLPADHWVFRANQFASVPPAFVARVPDGRAVGCRFGAVITNDDTLLFDLSPYHYVVRPSQHPVFLSLRLPPVHSVPGRVAVLTSRGVDNYYHFLLDVVPRLELIRRSGLTVDKYLVNRSLPFQRELLHELGVPDDRVIQSSDYPHIRADELVVASLPDSELRTPGWIVRYLRDRLLPDGLERPHRRIYIGRGRGRNNRVVRNEPAVLECLRRYGVTQIDPATMSVDEQIRCFAEAELVIAAHGAALANLVFCPRGVKILELFAPDYVYVCYWALAAQLDGADYRYLVGEGRVRRPNRPMMGVASDISVDLEKLQQLLDRDWLPPTRTAARAE